MRQHTRTVTAIFSDGEYRDFQGKKNSSYLGFPELAVRIRFPNNKARVFFGRSKREIEERTRTALVAYLDIPSVPQNRPAPAWKRAEISQFKAKHGLITDAEIATLRSELVNKLRKTCEIEVVQTTIKGTNE